MGKGKGKGREGKGHERRKIGREEKVTIGKPVPLKFLDSPIVA